MARIVHKGWFALGLCGCFLLGCGEGDDLIKKKLDIILADDLKAVAADLPKGNCADSMYYTIVSYKSYSQGMYSKIAVVDFYFLKNIKVKITRKYRYYAAVRLWDRYYNVYKFYGDTANGKSR